MRATGVRACLLMTCANLLVTCDSVLGVFVLVVECFATNQPTSTPWIGYGSLHNLQAFACTLELAREEVRMNKLQLDGIQLEAMECNKS